MPTLRPSLLLGAALAAVWISAVAVPGRAAGEPPGAAASAHPKSGLKWDATTVTYTAKPGDEAVELTFAVTNTSDRPIEIRDLRPSCGCTVADLPSVPWVLAPGARGSFAATADIKGKSGLFTKTIEVESSAGRQTLTLRVDIPETEETRRARNLQLAQADRQAVFRGDCAACHAAPTVGKTGGELFQLACGICHTAAHRAAMVPDLSVAREPRDEAYWRRWIADGRERTLMPAFAQRHGGPLTDAQIESLVAYLRETFAARPAGN